MRRRGGMCRRVDAIEAFPGKSRDRIKPRRASRANESRKKVELGHARRAARPPTTDRGAPRERRARTKRERSADGSAGEANARRVRRKDRVHERSGAAVARKAVTAADSASAEV